MSTVETHVAAADRESAIASLPRSWKTPIFLWVFSLLSALLFDGFGHSGTTTFTFTTAQTGSLKLPVATVPTLETDIILTIIALLMAALSTWFAYNKRKTPVWFSTIFAVLLLVALLTWLFRGQPLAVTGLLAGALALSTPLIFGALGGVVSERVGVVNVAIEGQLLAGAFVSAVVASITRSLLAGVIAAVVAGVLVSFVLAAFSITYLVDQVIVGVVIDGLVLGLTSFLYTTVLNGNTPLLNTPPSFTVLPIPLLSQIPLIGPVLFDQTIIQYLMYLAIVGVFFALFYTRWGLRVRAVGEHPQAADTVGINVERTRFWTVSLAGAIAGLGGAYYTLGSGLGFTINLTDGDGFIALAAVILGRWNPVRATLAALLFGFAENLQYVIGQNSPVPSQVLLMLPYVVTIFAVAGVVGQVRAPAASGRPYIKS